MKLSFRYNSIALQESLSTQIFLNAWQWKPLLPFFYDFMKTVLSYFLVKCLLPGRIFYINVFFLQNLKPLSCLISSFFFKSRFYLNSFFYSYILSTYWLVMVSLTSGRLVFLTAGPSSSSDISISSSCRLLKNSSCWFCLISCKNTHTTVWEFEHLSVFSFS